ncbi:hypothetical protein AB0G29_12860 [Streptomyces parvus]|uniref:hypothetical protein n=1 Tax=Streptomyces parvus TaxID=66428 RepID=UPI0033C1A1D3
MKLRDAAKDGLVRNDSVGPDYFDESDREQAVDAGVELVNALRRFGVDFDGVGVSPVCHTCTSVPDAYRVELGSLHFKDAEKIAVQLNGFAEEFQRMRDQLAADERGSRQKQPERRRRNRRRHRR